MPIIALSRQNKLLRLLYSHHAQIIRTPVLFVTNRKKCKERFIPIVLHHNFRVNSSMMHCLDSLLDKIEKKVSRKKKHITCKCGLKQNDLLLCEVF